MSTTTVPASNGHASPSQLKPDSYWSRLAIHRVPTQYLLGAALLSYLMIGLATLEGAPIWLAFGLGLAPWGTIAFFEIEWTYKHFGWIAAFALMAFVQTIHYAEHCIQVIQVHIFHTPLHDAQALFGSLNAEGVHFVGDTFLTIGMLLLITKFPRNPWLWVALPFQIIHQAEHTYLMFNYLFLGAPPGQPGLLASPGGALFGGVGLIRPDLHWIYNTLFTIPFVLALVYQLKRAYDQSLEEAFPTLPGWELEEVNRRMQTFEYAPSESVLAPGDDVDRLYVITEGEASVCQRGADGAEAEVATLRAGDYFGEVGLLVPDAPHTKTVRAKTRLRVLAMDAETFREVTERSRITHDEMVARAQSRLVANGNGNGNGHNGNGNGAVLTVPAE